jgi:hypothetical protein
MNLENLKELITKDSQIDSTELGIESLKIPQIHSKYLTILSDVKLLLTKQQHDLAILKLRKWKIYTGKASQEELELWGEDPSDLTLLKSDVEQFVEADPKVIELKSKIAVSEVKLKMVEEFLRSLNNRNFAIKSAIEWHKMMNGVV